MKTEEQDMKIEEKKVLVVGTGISGIAASKLLRKAQANVVLFDGNKDLDRPFARKRPSLLLIAWLLDLMEFL